MTDSDEPFGRYMHQKATYEFVIGNRFVFPVSFILMVLHCICYSCFRHGFDSVITNCYPMRVFPKIVHNVLRPGEGLFAVSEPVLFIAVMQKFPK